MHLQIYRYSPDDGQPPRMQDYRITPDPADRKLLDVLIRIKTIDIPVIASDGLQLGMGH